MTTWLPQDPPHRSHCARCGAHWRLHQADPDHTCPQAHRPEDLAAAVKALRAAEAKGDQGAIFVARGEVQRLGGDPDAEYIEEADLQRLAPLPAVAYTNVTADDWVLADQPRQVRCSWCGGALVTVGAIRTCDVCGREVEPADQAAKRQQRADQRGTP